MEGKLRQDPEQEAELELLKEQNNTLAKKLEFSMRTLEQAREQVKENEKEIELLKDQSVEKVTNFKTVTNNPELEKEIQLLKKQKAELEEKLSKALSAPAAAIAAGPKPSTSAAHLAEIQKLNELRVANEAKIKEQFVENKRLDGRFKAQTVQLEALMNKMASNTVAKNSENHSKQLEHASNRVAEVTKELQDKKKELVQMKQETTKLNARVYELEKKISYYEKKSA
jgi:chromosome segregation ATPase